MFKRRHLVALVVRVFATIVMTANTFAPTVEAGAQTQENQSGHQPDIAMGLTLGANAPSDVQKVPLLSDQIARQAQGPNGNARPPQIQVTAEPAIYTSGKPIQLSWQIQGMTAVEQSTASIVIYAPAGLNPIGAAQTLSPDGTLSLPVNGNAGATVWQASASASFPLNFTFELVLNGDVVDKQGVVVDQARYSLASGQGATLHGLNGKVAVGIPAADADEPLALDIRNPGPNALDGVSLSWQPVEILAVGKNSQRNLHSFKAPLTIQLQYDEATVQANGWDDNSLSIYYYDPVQNDWFPMETQVDKVTHTLTTQSDHLTVFDWNANNWQSQSAPTVDTFRVSDFTGAGTYNINLWTPPGPGGLQPSLALTYNSQIVDESSAYTQGSWAGVGWNLDTGAILRNMHGTDSDTTDDTFSISAGGVTGLLLPISTSGSITNYNTADQSFMKVQFDSTAKTWTAWAKDGTQYVFSATASTSSTSGCVSSLSNLDLTWRWSLTTVTDTHGNSLSYTYTTEQKNGCQNQIAVYPATITYPNGKYRVNFLLDTTARTDYQTSWTSSSARTLYGTKRLSEVQIQYNPSGTWTNVRRYVLSYAPNTEMSNIILPNFSWSAGGKTLTLVGVQEIGSDGSALPAVQFTYGDNMHITGVDNGQGGTVQMTYERQAYYDDVNKDLRTFAEYFGTSSTQDCYYQNGTWNPSTAWSLASGTSVGCYLSGSQGRLRVDAAVGLHTIPENVAKPGARYRLHVEGGNGPSKSSTQVVWGFEDTSCINCDQNEYPPTHYTSFVLEDSFEMPVTYNPTTTQLDLQCDDCTVSNFQFQLFLTYWRVTQRTVTIQAPGLVTTNAPYAYHYAGFAMNNTDNSAAVATYGNSAVYSKTLREFRGHALTEAVDPAGLATLNWFNQTDNLKGRAYDTLVGQYGFFDNMYNGVDSDWALTTGAVQDWGGCPFADGVSIKNTSANWSMQLSRSSASVGQGEIAIAHVRLCGTGALGQVGLTGNGTSLVVSLAGSGVTANGVTLLGSGNFILGKFYAIMMYADAANGYRVRIWELDDPSNSGEAVISGVGGGARTFYESVNNGTISIDGYAEVTPYHETITNYASAVQYDTIANNGIPDLAGSTTLLGFKDLQIAWNRATSVERRTYDGDAAFVGTRQTLTYDSYGNVTAATDASGNNGTWTTYRTTATEYYPNTASNILSMPARQVVQDSLGTQKSEVLYFYDGNAAYTTPPTKGDLTIQRTWMQASNYSQISYGYDSYGNRNVQTTYQGYGTSTTSPAAGTQETTSTTYEATYHTYATSVTNALTQPTQTGYNFALGLPTSLTDPNNAVTTATYDGFGRVKTITAPGDTSPTLQVTYYDTRIPFQVDLNQNVNGVASIRLSKFYDGAGHQIQTQTVGAVVNGTQQTVVVDTQFNNLGLVSKQSVPYTVSYNAAPAFVSQIIPPSTSQPNTQTNYDSFERPSSVVAPNGNQTQTTYTDLTSTVTDPQGNATTTTSDVWGRTVLTHAPTGPDVSYQYDVLNRLTDTTRAGNLTHIDYDGGGHKLDMTDPDMGAWIYQYDGAGNLTIQTDARGCTMNMDSYDNLNRLLHKYSVGACGTQVATTYRYDEGGAAVNAIGRRTSMADESGSATWTYDNRGRMIQEVKTITGATSPFSTSWTYNSADLPITMTYPDSEVLTYGYNTDGSLNSVSSSLGTTYASNTQYDEAGRLKSIDYGSGIIHKTVSYFAWGNASDGGFLSSITTMSGSTPLQNLAYTYDRDGNVLTIVDSLAGPQTQTFGYDSLNRLTSASATGGSNGLYSDSYQYDSATGNLSLKGGLTYNYTNSAHPHAVSSLSNGNTYQYDANGDLTQRVVGGQTTSLSYDAQNRMVAVSQSGSISAPVFSDGFESGDMSAWTSSAGLTVESTNVHGGTHAAEGNTTNGNTYAKKTLPSTYTDGYARIYFNLVSYSSQVNLLRLRTAADVSIGYLFVNTSGKLAFRNDTAATTTTSVTGVTTGWHALELHATINGASGVTEVWLDGVKVTDLSLSANLGTTPIGELQIGEVQSGRTYDVVFDDVVFDIQRIGPIGTATPTPTATATSTPTSTPAATNTPTATPVPPTNTPTPTPTSGSGPTPTPTTAPVFRDGFESGNMSAWTSSGGLTVESATVHTGTYAAEGNTTNGNTYAKKTLPSTYTDGYSRIYFDLVSYSSQVNLLRIRTAADVSIGYLFVNTSGKLAFRNDTAATTTTSATGVTAGWHALELHATINGASGITEVWLDGVKVTDLSMTANLGTTAIGELQIGEVQSGRTYDVIFDDAVFSTQQVGLAWVPSNGLPSPYSVAKNSGPVKASVDTWNGISNISLASLVQALRVWLLPVKPARPTPMATASPTAADTATPSAPVIPTETATLVAVPTDTDTPAATATPSDTALPTQTSAPTDAASATPTTAPVASATPSLTPMASDTSTPTASATSSPLGTDTSTATVSPSLPSVSGPAVESASLLSGGVFSQASFVYDGEDKRVESAITTDQGTTTTYFVGTYYELTGAAVTKYYYAGTQRIAMRAGGTLSFLLTDHLGSTSISTDGTGVVTSQQWYTAWGEVRYASGTLPTNYSYTGQYSYTAQFGMLFYNARWYDPSSGRFTQADAILLGGVQGYDRYGYANNNPVLFSDPSGHVSCSGSNWDDGPQCTSTAEYQSNATAQLQQAIAERYDWGVVVNFSLNYLINIYQTGLDIERNVDKLTAGNGLAWMNKNMGNINITVNFTKFNSGGSFENPLFGGTVFLSKGLESDPGQIRADLAHELSEIWDLKSGHASISCLFYCGGVADQMNQAFGGNVINNPSICRYCDNGGVDQNGNPMANLDGVPKAYQWTHDNYANGATQDYFAEAFSVSMEPDAGNNAIDGPIPSGVEDWLNAEIQHYAP